MRRARGIGLELLAAAALFCGRAEADTYVDTVADLGNTTTTGVVTLGGYITPSDGGGGTLFPSGSKNCKTSGLIFKDGKGYCLYRVKPTNNVREWGALCDVVAVRPQPSTTTATWVSVPLAPRIGVRLPGKRTLVVQAAWRCWDDAQFQGSRSSMRLAG